MGVGKRLKKILEEKNVTIKELSIIADVSLNTLYAITKRDNNSLDPDILRRISSTLNIPPQYLLGFYGTAPSLTSAQSNLMNDTQNTPDGLLKQIIDLARNVNTEGRLLCIENLKELEKNPKYLDKEEIVYRESLKEWNKRDLHEVEMMYAENLIDDALYEKLRIILTKYISIPDIEYGDKYDKEDEKISDIIQLARKRMNGRNKKQT